MHPIFFDQSSSPLQDSFGCTRPACELPQSHKFPHTFALLEYSRGDNSTTQLILSSGSDVTSLPQSSLKVPKIRARSPGRYHICFFFLQPPPLLNSAHVSPFHYKSRHLLPREPPPLLDLVKVLVLPSQICLAEKNQESRIFFVLTE